MWHLREGGWDKCGKIYSQTLQWWRSHNELESHLSSLTRKNTREVIWNKPWPRAWDRYHWTWVLFFWSFCSYLRPWDRSPVCPIQMKFVRNRRRRRRRRGRSLKKQNNKREEKEQPWLLRVSEEPTALSAATPAIY